MNKMKELNQEAFDKAEFNRSLYKGILNTDDTYDWDYSLTDPHVFPLMRNYLSRSNPNQTKIRLEARTAEDYTKRQINQSFLNWELGEMMHTSLFYRMYFSGYASGRGYAKTGWAYAKRVKVKTDRGTEIIMRDKLNRADAQFVRFNDLLIPNRNIPLLQEQPYVGEYIQMRIGDMLDDNETGNYWKKDWLEKLRKAGPESKLLDYQADFVRDEALDNEMAFRSAYVALICMHTLEGDTYYIPANGDEEIVNEDVVNRYWHGHYPYIDFCPFPEDDEYFSMALIDAVGDLQVAATEILNQTLTNIRQINSDMWIAGTSASQTPDWQFVKRPNGIIRVAGDVTQVAQVTQKDNTMPALKMADAIQTRIERTGGISSLYSSGAPSQNINQTARGAQIIDQNIDTNMRMIFDLFGEQVVKPLGEHFLELNAQYVTEDQTFAITGKKNVRDLITIKPEDVSANFDVFVNSERMQKQTPASRQASLQNLMTILGAEAQKNGVLTDVTPIVEALIDSYPELDNVEEVVVSLDEKSKRDIATLERGQEVEVKVKDPHLELMQYATIHLEDNADLYKSQPNGEEIMSVFGKYMVDHTRFMQTAQEIKMMTAPVMPGVSSPDQMQRDMNNPDQAGLPNQGNNLGDIAGGR